MGRDREALPSLMTSERKEPEFKLLAVLLFISFWSFQKLCFSTILEMFQKVTVKFNCDDRASLGYYGNNKVLFENCKNIFIEGYWFVCLLVYLFLCFQVGSLYVAQAGLILTILLP